MVCSGANDRLTHSASCWLCANTSHQYSTESERPVSEAGPDTLPAAPPVACDGYEYGSFFICYTSRTLHYCFSNAGTFAAVLKPAIAEARRRTC